MKKIIKIVNVVIAFFLTLSIIAFTVLNLISNTLLKKDNVIKILNKNDFYEIAKTDLKNKFEEYEYQSGLPKEVFENLYSDKMIEDDINIIIDKIYDNKEISNDSKNIEKIKNNLTENINKYLDNNNIQLDSEQENNIDSFGELIVETYEKEINIISDKLELVQTKFEKAQKYINRFLVISLICLIVQILILLFINFSSKWDFINTIGISLLASGILLLLLNITINKNIQIDNIVIFTKSLSYLVKIFITELLAKINDYAGIDIIIGSGIIILSSTMKNTSKN